MHLISQNQLVIRRLKTSSREKSIVDSSDFLGVELKIESFGQIEGLNQGFKIFSYAVVNWEGKPVDLSEYQSDTQEGYHPIAEIYQNFWANWGFSSERMDYE